MNLKLLLQTKTRVFLLMLFLSSFFIVPNVDASTDPIDFTKTELSVKGVGTVYATGQKYIDFKVLIQNYYDGGFWGSDGYDELDDIAIYYLNPVDKEWVLIFHGDCDNDNAWQMFDTESNVEHSENNKSNSGDKTYGWFRFFPPEDVFPNYLIYKAVVDWDQKSDQTNAGADNTYYYKYMDDENSNVLVAPSWESFSSFAYDNDPSTSSFVEFDFLMTNLYGYGVVSDASLWSRHELDDLYIKYREVDGENDAWIYLVHGDCDNSSTDTEFQIFSKTDDVSLLEEYTTSFNHFAKLKWTIPSSMIGKNIEFCYQYKWDEWADVTNTDPFVLEEFEIQTHTECYKPSEGVIVDQLSSKYPSIKYTWEIENSISVDYIDVRRSQSPDSEGASHVTVKTVENIDDNLTSFEFVNSSIVAEDESTNNEYLLVDGKKYTYWVDVYYDNGVKQTNYSTRVESEQVSFTPYVNSFNAVSAIDDNGAAYVELTWGDFSRVASKILSRQLSGGNFQNLNVSADDWASGSYHDYSAESCKEYTYKLELTSADEFQGLSFSLETSMLLNAGLAGALVDLEASKGFYDERVVLDWTNAGSAALDRIKVKRKQVGAQGYENLAVLDSKENSYIDETALSGIYYEYVVYAEGTCGDSDTISVDSEIASVGFCQRTGIVAGQVTYGGGAPVSNVRVGLERSNADETGFCVASGDEVYISVEDTTFANQFSEGFTVEAWFKLDNADDGTLFSTGIMSDENEGFSLEYLAQDTSYLFSFSGSDFSFQIPDSVYQSIQSSSVGYNHFAVTYNDGLAIVYCNSIEVCRVDASYRDRSNASLIFAYNYAGKIDEVRVWSTALSIDDISANFTRLLSGTEDFLDLYWRLDEGAGNEVYDMSNHRAVFNKQHGKVHYPENSTFWTNDIPVAEHLALMGLTDDDGYYIIDGIRYAGTGESFKVTPMYDVHEFSPLSRVMFIGNSSLTQNDKNFEDISSFKVKGQILYEGTGDLNPFPVADVYIKVDGNYVMGEDGLPAMTENDGSYEVDVPIGEHYIEVEKKGHKFVTAYYPQRKDSTVEYEVFENPIDKINFYDVTRVKLIGKVVGGAVEAAKPTGSIVNAPVNNIDTVRITLSSSGRQYNLTNNKLDTAFTTSDVTGEFCLELLPELYKVESMVNPVYSFKETDLVTIDLRNVFEDNYVEDSIFSRDVEGELYFDSICTAMVYNAKKDWVYRTTPQLKVTNLDGGALFGDSLMAYQNADGKDTVVQIARTLLDGSIEYDLGRPTFRMMNYYGYTISAYESYVYGDDVFDVPVADGVIKIVNNCAEDAAVEGELPFDEDGEVNYNFACGMPNLASPFTLSTSFTLLIGTTSYDWEKNAMECLVLGAVPTGSNFVTKGPDDIDFILRDPAGSNSFATLEEGTSMTKNWTTSASLTGAYSQTTSIELGSTFTTDVGTPFFTVATEIDFEDTHDVAIATTSTAEGQFSRNVTTTLNTSYSTSESPDYVGAMGDLFIGRSSNIIYGFANSLELMTHDEVLDPSLTIDTLSIDGVEYVLSQKKAMRISPEVNTTFVYSQNHIEESLIPNLRLLRDLYYRSHTANYTIDTAIHEDSEKFLTNNDDVSVWGADAVGIDDRFDGPSYIFSPPMDGDVLLWDADSVRFYNVQINQWVSHLYANEVQKLSAEAFNEGVPSNVSFDAASRYSSSATTVVEKALSESFTTELSSTFTNTLGATLNSTGVSVAFETSVSASASVSHEKTVSNERTVSFELADEDAGDYFSVDVLECKSGNGPVFRTRGGQTSCPYEGAEVTDYYMPGTILSEATMQIEKPVISIDKNLITGVSEDATAYFTIELSNISETGDDGWYNLIVDPATNPYGAKVALDGAAMGANGKQILIPAGQTLYKTIAMTKGRSDVDEYDDIAIILHSQCQYDPTDFVADIADTVTISTYFVPACSPVELSSPSDNWIVNISKGGKLNVAFEGYNLQHEKMQSIAFQYKAKSASTWTTDKWWVNNSDMVNQDDIADTLFIDDASSFSYEWDMADLDLSDREYQVRAVSFCDNEVNSYSEILTGMLDTKEPRLFGTPEPADGILAVGEDISIYFDEEVEAGLISSSNVTVKGVLNGYETEHDVCMQFDGAANSITTGEGMQLANRSFTLEFWLKISDFATNGNLISYAYDGTNGLSLVMKDSKMQVTMNGISQEFVCATNATWHHYAISYDSQEDRLRLIQDNGSLDDNNLLAIDGVGALEENGVLTIGQDEMSTSFEGNIHELRAWSMAVSPANVYSSMYTILNGKEMGLMSYWRMDEAFGELLQDKASSRHAIIDGATWLVNPTGKSYDFTGSNALLADISAIPVTLDGDLTIELWVKADVSSVSSTFFSTGDPATAQAANLPDVLTIGLDDNGYVQVLSNEQELLSTTEINDDKWHHIALVVKRTANAVLYLDGNLESSVYGSDFGSLGGSKLALGALKDNERDVVSNYFTGAMDEVRIWHSARPLEIMTAYRNACVDGKDLGLRAYFPFETYQKNSYDFYESTATVADQSYSIYDDSSYCGACEPLGDSIYSDLTPNIRRQRELSEVNCDVTVNVDKIVIQPTDPDYKLENCVLEISIDGIYDKYENRMASAATWMAYVDRNTVTWTETGVELVKDVNDEISFTSTVRNSGGTFESYSIENLPAWLTASPSSGTIAPDASKEITFTINGGLNVGMFNEDIYLKTDFGFDEKMNVALRVKGEVPNWTVDYSNNFETMSFIGRVNIEGRTSADEYDMVAVFSGDDCRGVANVEYFSELDEYLLMLTVYGDVSGDELSYSVYDASTGEVYTSCSVDTAFSAQMVYGSVANPVEFTWDNTIKNSISLVSGWNWISFNATLDMYTNLNDLMESVNLSNNDLMKSVSQGTVSQYNVSDDASQWLGTITLPQNDFMYQCYIKDGGELVYEGVSISPSDYPMDIVSGWNRIAYVPSVNLEVNEALSAYQASVDDVIKSQLGFAIYTGFSWIGNLEYLEPGKGYMLKRTGLDDASFKYPVASSFVSSKTSIVNVDDNFGLDPYQFSSSTSMLLNVEGVNDERAYLMSYVGDELRGVSLIDDELMFVTVYGNEDEEAMQVHFKVKTSSGLFISDNECQFSTTSLVGSLEQPFVVTVKQSSIDDVVVEHNELNVYPNPMTSIVNVQLYLDEEETVIIEVFNGLGQKVFEAPQALCKQGVNDLEWDGRRLPAGVYTMVVNVGDKVHTVRLSKIN